MYSRVALKDIPKATDEEVTKVSHEVSSETSSETSKAPLSNKVSQIPFKERSSKRCKLENAGTEQGSLALNEALLETLLKSSTRKRKRNGTSIELTFNAPL
ncbi:hypothetical protein TWF730_005954 [Orbilia blumenaviensis]|uniref:Uncharacterized protein n=1 Tax=Orbilia blumenaviensis TaxID=1796055 RepID=A0AAV9VJW4_9PEZI